MPALNCSFLFYSHSGFIVIGIFVIYYNIKVRKEILWSVIQTITIVIYGHKWRLYYECIIDYASSSLVLARVFNYATRVVNYAPRVMLQIVASLTIIIYNCNMFIVHATKSMLPPGANTKNFLQL